MKFFFILGRLTRKVLDLSHKIVPRNKIVLLAISCFLVFNINIRDRDIRDLFFFIGYGSMWILSIAIYYRMFSILRGTLGWLRRL